LCGLRSRGGAGGGCGRWLAGGPSGGRTELRLRVRRLEAVRCTEIGAGLRLIRPPPPPAPPRLLLLDCPHE